MILVAAGVSTPPARPRLEFAYDYKNRRIAKKVFVEESGTDLQPVVWGLTKDLRFVYDGYQMIAELDATFATGTGVAGITPIRGVVRSYLWGQDLSGTMTGAGGVGGLLSVTHQGVTYHTCSDANGNITGLLAADGKDAGKLVARFDYDPFGNRLTNTGPDVEICPMGFSSKYTDSETGLVDYGLRIYSPPLARWLSTDPIGEEGGINLYGFVDNDPVNNWDYLGLTTIGEILDSFFTSRTIRVHRSGHGEPLGGPRTIRNPDPGEKLWNMGTSDPYTRIVKDWRFVRFKLDEVKKDISANFQSWKTNHQTPPNWTPRMGTSVVVPNAERYQVSSPAGTGRQINAILYAAWKASDVQSEALHTSAIGSFTLFVTAEGNDKSNCKINVWMFNMMSEGSFNGSTWNPGSFFPNTYMRNQYMWWNWTEDLNQQK